MSKAGEDSFWRSSPEPICKVRLNGSSSPGIEPRSTSDGEKEIPFLVPSLAQSVVGRTQSSMSLEQGSGGLKYGSAEYLRPSASSLRHLRGPGNASLGSLNPELYKNPEEGDLLEYPEGHIGRLWFTVEYDREAEKLAVLIGKARNLPSRDLTNPNASDPFVRVFLLPDERRYVQTKTKRKTVNPNFGESFTFDIAKDTFEERTLKFMVFDIDGLQRHIPVGTVYYGLTDYAHIKRPKLTTWRDLKRDDSEVACQLGELHCALSFNPSMERFTVTIIEAKDLRPPDDSEDVDTYCKIALSVSNKPVKQKRTRVIKKSLCPTFSESFNFKVPPDKMDHACLSIQVMQVKPERQIGRLSVAGQMYARGKSLEHWQAMMLQPKDTLQHWHYLTE